MWISDLKRNHRGYCILHDDIVLTFAVIPACSLSFRLFIFIRNLLKSVSENANYHVSNLYSIPVKL